MATTLKKKRNVDLYRVRQTVMEMLSDRGYLVAEFEVSMTKEEFKAKFGEEPKRSDLDFLKSMRANPSEQIYVFFSEEEKVGVSKMKTYLERMKAEKVHRAILVIQDDITYFARNALEEAAGAKYLIETFMDTELLMNVSKHNLVPEHQLLAPEEKKALLQQYKLKESQLPGISVKDPVARYYGLVAGQVVRIIRNSETAGRYITYRLATN